MKREDFSDLAALIVVAEERSFTRAAARLGMSQPALSQLIQNFEKRLGVRLLTRTTRSVSPTEAGERLIQMAMPRLGEIEAELNSLAELRDLPSGTIRITTTEHAADTVLWPRLGPFMRLYPDIRVEVTIDYGLSDIVAERFEMGIRLGDEVERDMIAVRIGPDVRFCAVASPAYLASNPAPTTPQELTLHNCINLRLPTHGGLYAWELTNGVTSQRVRVEGQFTVNGIYQVITAALAGLGIGFVPEDIASNYISSGQLIPVMENWMPAFTGYHLYYPSRHTSRALILLVEALRHSK